MQAFSLLEIHQSSESFKVMLNRVVFWHPFSLPFTLLPSFNMPLIGTRMRFTSEPDSVDLFSPLFSLKRLKSKRLTTEMLIRELLFANAAAIATDMELQRLVSGLVKACDFLRLTISIKKTEVI